MDQGLRPIRPGYSRLITGDLVGAVGVLPLTEGRPFGFGRLPHELLSPLTGGFELAEIGDRRRSHRTPLAAVFDLEPTTEAADAPLSTGVIDSARKATPPRPSMFQGVATSLATVTS